MTDSSGGPERSSFPSAIVILAAVAALIVFYYWARADIIGVRSNAGPWFPLTGVPRSAPAHYLWSAVLLGLIPLVVARVATRLTWRQLGLGIGRWRLGLWLLALGVPLALAAGKIGSLSPSMRAVYPLGQPDAVPGGFPTYAALELLYYGSWEALFRGALLLGLRKRIGDGTANALQTALSVLAHFGRAAHETVAAFPAGLVFGWATLRTRSIWYVVIIHWLVGTSLDWFVVAVR